jgi:hypothetical protein
VRHFGQKAAERAKNGYIFYTPRYFPNFGHTGHAAADQI